MNTPCDYLRDKNGFSVCPFEGYGYESERCRVWCGLGVDEDDYPEDDDYEDDDYEDYYEDYYEDNYCPSSTNGDYSPSNPWDAPGMSLRDFI